MKLKPKITIADHLADLEDPRVERTKHHQLIDIITIETRYYISSLPNNAQKLGESVRSQWGIENSLHWVLDVGFPEDDCRIRKDNAPQNFAMIRHI